MSAWDTKMLRAIYDRSAGCCHICHKKLAFTRYGQIGTRGAWEVDHSVPRANGGTDRIGNLYPAHIACNRSKQKRSNRGVRRVNGVTRAPLSRTRRNELRTRNAFAGALAGAALGRFFGIPGVVIGGLLGIAMGRRVRIGP